MSNKQINWDFLFSNYSSPYENYQPFSTASLPLISIPTTSGTGSQVTQVKEKCLQVAQIGRDLRAWDNFRKRGNALSNH